MVQATFRDKFGNIVSVGDKIIYSSPKYGLCEATVVMIGQRKYHDTETYNIIRVLPKESSKFYKREILHLSKTDNIMKVD